MINTAIHDLHAYDSTISSLIDRHHYRKIVLQVPKEFLPFSYQLCALLRTKNPQAQTFVLYDSLKESCCTDVLGAEHVGYDCLVHFGKACFSSEHKPNHHYIFGAAGQQELLFLKQALRDENNMDSMVKSGVGYVLADQKYYEWLKNEVFFEFKLGGTGIQLLRLPMDAKAEDQYLVFGYHGQFDAQNPRNILLVSDPQDASLMPLVQQLSFSLKSLKEKVGQQAFQLQIGHKQIQPLNQNNNKLLMQRYSLISQLDQHQVFGIIVSNTATTFHKQALRRCQQLLSAHHKKSFTFMMNNLNEAKLGNFSEIEVYVIISCYQHSLFGIKDFHRIIVTPNDLQAAFAHRPFDQYAFDCASRVQVSPLIQPKLAEQEVGSQLAKIGNGDITLREKIQTIDFYRQREFKGLDFGQKKEVKKMTKGKVGLAQQYKNIQ